MGSASSRILNQKTRAFLSCSSAVDQRGIDVFMHAPLQMRPHVELPIGHIINCTGPNADPEKTHDRLIENLVASRLARRAEAGVGLDVDSKNRVLDRDGAAQPSWLAMGALTRGHWWEVTAISEIAHQAQIMSGAIMEYLGILNAAARINRHH